MRTWLDVTPVQAAIIAMLEAEKHMLDACLSFEKKRKEKFTLFSDHNGSLLRRQPGAMTIGHSPKGKEKP